MDCIEVSIICNTYNHKNYIKDALDGFVMQKTNFSYEVLIHDDASTDGTADIIREYEKMYPDIIKPIYQTENQYSKGIPINKTYGFSRAKGKYIALCEGDDFWIDPDKLQKQYDMLEAYPNVDICAHEGKIMNANTKEYTGKVAPSKNNCVFSVDEVINGGGGFVVTCSLMIRKSVLLNPPEFVKYCMLDYTMQISGSLSGGMLYIAKPMSVYRVAVENSWSYTISHSEEKNLRHRLKIKKMFEILNEETNYKYDKSIQRGIYCCSINIFVIKPSYISIIRDEYKKRSIKDRLNLEIAIIIAWLKIIKRRIVKCIKG